MAEPVCERSLWVTLTAAMSTVGLFTVANWGLASLTDNSQDQGFLKQIADHTMFAFAMPILAVNNSLLNVFKVWAVKRALKDEFRDQPELCPQHTSISIITLCPIYIQILVIEPSGDELGEHLAQYDRVMASDLEQLCPLELQPRSRGTNDTSNACPHSVPGQWIYLKLPATYELKDARERYALLASGLAPKDTELGYLRARSVFQSMVTASQAIGYMLSTTERMLEHLGISPVEAIVSYLSILATVQLLMEIYACGSYRCALLLHLRHDERMRFSNAVRKDLDSLLTWKQHCMFRVFTIAQGLLVGYSSLYCVSHYQSHICRTPAVLFFVALEVYCFLPKDYLMIYNSREQTKTPGLLCINFLFVCSLIFAVIATIADWKVFQGATHHRLAKIFPHFSS